MPELANPAIREHFIYSYRVIDQVSGDDMHVLAIIHGGRLLDSALADRL